MRFLSRIALRRRIDAISAVFLPFDADGRPDLDAFEHHLARTAGAGLRVAVNMDTGAGPELDTATRARVLAIAGPGCIAGAMPEDDLAALADAGALPILFPPMTPEMIAERVAGVDAALAFELSPAFSPAGAVWDLDDVRRVMAIPQIVGLKHSSLDRIAELDRLELRDRERPGFAIYTGNDLAIDMVMYGSDYLLGLSTFEPEAFALRDRWWADGDERFFALNDALQALGAVVFRPPVPAYKHSAAVYLGLGEPHPSCPRRPAWEAELHAPLRDAIAALVGTAQP